MTTGTLHSPPGLQTVLNRVLPEAGVAFGFTADSDAADGVLSMHAGVVNLGSNAAQNLCEETVSWSVGADGIDGTDDDVLATWLDPAFSFGPADVVPAGTGWPFGFTDLSLDGVIHPQASSIAGVTYAGVFDTRSVHWTGEDDYCEALAATSSISCVACADDPDALACLEYDGVDMKATRVDVDLVEVRCDDVLDRVAAGTCSDTYAAFYDADEDGTYERCPTWTN